MIEGLFLPDWAGSAEEFIYAKRNGIELFGGEAASHDSPYIRLRGRCWECIDRVARTFLSELVILPLMKPTSL
jgi:hypothetical protein